jgi:hypothetical protein
MPALIKNRVKISPKDFEAELIRHKHGWTFQLWYDGQRCAGMSEFAGTIKGLKLAWREFLGELIASSDSLDWEDETDAPA